MKGEIFLTEELKANENAPKKVVRPFRRNNNRKKILNSTVAQQTATVSNEEIKNIKRY